MSERCNQCGGEFKATLGELTALLVCKDCGREVPRGAFRDVDDRFDAGTLGLLHQITRGEFL